MKSLILFFLIALSFSFVNAQTEKRVALVIGNGKYTGNPLRNAVNDANLMEATLKSLGFEVIKCTNASRQQMEHAVQSFSEKMAEAKVSLFYYAGHGIQSNGVNYLIPVDAVLDKESDLKFQALSVSFIVDEFEQYPDNINIVILDACRDNPLKTWQASRGGLRGFKAISPSSGTIIAFATSEGSTAADGTGNNGLFTEKLVQQMRQPYPIETVFKNTRNEVEKYSGGKQSPQEWTKLKGEFYFVKPDEKIAYQPVQQQTYRQDSMAINEALNQSQQDLTITEEIVSSTIRITSEMDGMFYLDGKPKGNFATGRVYTLNNIPVGLHELQIGQWKQNILVEKGITVDVKAILETGSIQIISQIEGDLYLNDKLKGKVIFEQPILYEKIPIGSYILKIGGWLGQCMVETNKITLVNVKASSIQLISEIDGMLYVDGVEKEKIMVGKEYTISQILIGNHKFRIGNWEREITVTEKPVKIKIYNENGTLVDPRDGQTYKLVEIENSLWMAQNLNFRPDDGDSWCFDKDKNNCSQYGRLYNWETAKKVCPSGWHLPSREEFELLLTQTGGAGVPAYKSIKETGSTGLNFMLGGWRGNQGNYSDIGRAADYWSSTPAKDDCSWCLMMILRSQKAVLEYFHEDCGFYVRCVHD